MTFTPAVFDTNGVELPSEVKIASAEIAVEYPEAAVTADEVVATIFIGPTAEAEGQLEAKEALQWMLSAGESGYFTEDELVAEDEELSAGEVGDPGPGAETGLTITDNTKATIGPDINAAKAIPRPSKVGVPKGYVYCTKYTTSRCKPKALHDYCTWSPDRFLSLPKAPKADFRGPCARHDMSIDKIRKKNISLSSKRSQRKTTDTTFKKHIRQNCSYAYYQGKWTVERNRCYGAASTYYGIVQLKTRVWNGK
ncbi:phospholipase A2 [Brevibacterium sp.]|uniref:phospholipase A2 n=1 Tax=Brevibacterium sp. TaxID=1701 RepID=UPI0025C11080|nr:phospholipase A2 [Brevibacterium sp.]